MHNTPRQDNRSIAGFDLEKVWYNSFADFTSDNTLAGVVSSEGP